MEIALENDVRRAVILGLYIRAWGMPKHRVVARRKDDEVEVYSFQSVHENKIIRYATLGVSKLLRENGGIASWEIYLVVPKDNGGASEVEVESFLLDVMAYSLRSDVKFSIGQTIPASLLVPESWKARALLLDEPRGEPEYFDNIHVGVQHVKIIWLVPIHSDERERIIACGLDEFDRAESATDWSLADPNRASFFGG